MPQAPEFFMGGGALYSTGRDYLTFLRMLLGERQARQLRRSSSPRPSPW